VHAGTVELLVDQPVFLAAQRHVPARQAVLDLPVGARVLLEDDHLHAAIGQGAGHLGAGGRAADDRDDVPGLSGHRGDLPGWRNRPRAPSRRASRAFAQGVISSSSRM
jgi:hypothetical protein